MADLVTRLKLDDKQFRDNIAKSKKEVQMFKNAGSNILGTLTKMGTALGVAASVGEGFNKMMSSSQTFGDKANEAIAGAKGAVTEFFYALGTGDFNNFLSGMGKMIEKAKQAQAALDQLGNTKISYQFVRSESRREVATAKTQANNLELSKEERQAGFDAWGKGLNKMQKDVKVYEGEVINAVKALALENTKLVDISIADIKRMARLDIKAPSFRKDEKEKLSKQYEEYLEKQKVLARERGKSYVINGKILTYAQRENELAKKYKDAILFNNLLVRKNDDEWGSIVARMQEADNATEEMGSQIEEYNNALRGFKKEAGKTITTTVKVVAEEGSLAKLEEELKDLKAKFKLAVDEESRKKLDKAIAEKENEIHTITFRAKFEKPELPKDDKSDLKVEMPKLDKIEIPKLNNVKPINNEVLSSITQYSDAIGNLTGVLGSFNTAQEASAVSVLQWASSSMSAIANMIQVIQTFQAAQVAAAATDAATTTAQVANSSVKIAANTAEGASEAGKQAAKTPVVGWLMIAGAVAAALAAFASIPKFAKGGIFQGGKTFGDMNIARVNSGEMILNNSQQRNLWNLLDGTTTATSNKLGGSVEFKIKGNELVGVLNNYSKKLSRR